MEPKAKYSICLYIYLRHIICGYFYILYNNFVHVPYLGGHVDIQKLSKFETFQIFELGMLTL